MCLDWDEEIVVKPNYRSSLNISLRPCDEIHYHGYKVDDIDENCNSDKDV